MPASKFVRLNTGASMPTLGLGTWKSPPGAVEKAVEVALKNGYKLVDTAAAYDNEKEVGLGIKASGVPREEIFLTTKLNNTDHEDPAAALAASLKALDTTYLDLWLMHWPCPSKNGAPNRAISWIDTWKAMEKIYKENPDKVRAIGVSNVSVKFLDELLKVATVVPAVNQVESSPSCLQADIYRACVAKGISITAYSPLGSDNAPLARNPTVVEIAKAHGVTPTCVLISFHANRPEVTVIPKSVTPSRVVANMEIIDLTPGEVQKLSEIEKTSFARVWRFVSAPSFEDHGSDAAKPGTLGVPEGSDELFTPVCFPCGRTMPNRLVKVAMYEHLANLFGGPPNAAHFQLYSRWAPGKWGMIMTGNVQVSREHLALGRDLIVPDVLDASTIQPFAQLADIIHAQGCAEQVRGANVEKNEGTLAIMQLAHGGRQSANIIGGRWPFVPPLAPSPVPLGRKSSQQKNFASAFLSYLTSAVLFQTPRAMSDADIDDAVEAFVRGARLAIEAGFDGIELHAAHGYLISQFMSPKTNLREDEYSARTNPLRFLHRIVSAIRAPGVAPKHFILGLKLNAADYTDYADEKHPLKHLQEIASWKMVDFIEVSGGDYESPAFLSNITSTRQAIFSSFSREAVYALESSPDTKDYTPLVLLSGGLRSLPILASVLKQRHAHLLGFARLSVFYPELPRQLVASLARRRAGHADDFLMVPPPDPTVNGFDIAIARNSTRWWERCEHAIVSLLVALWSLFSIEMPKLIGAGTSSSWYNVMMRRMCAGQDVDYAVGGAGAVLRMWLWTAPGKAESRPLWDSWIVMGIIGTMIGFAAGVAFM
ncbi:uncharacterized protein FIBRA_05424 [Fibroporia radiculosa]|uniref:NADP-dependent oxidoreductase domain-containing protein n=1 Tax=Fibroporia radiculosa TaxID=599839 RepID=J4IAQ0_9APHY|nr:uncharacterized protein FIBRA_05424 [Fibroporia radiculosa]CCM03296.1 predicted protein [Fibroporia radiculosa]